MPPFSDNKRSGHNLRRTERFALVLRGGGDFAERTKATRLAHSLWKNATKEPFRMAGCLSSPVGRAYISSQNPRPADPAPMSPAKISSALKDASHGVLFEKALASATELFEAEARKFSGSRSFFETQANRAQ